MSIGNHFPICIIQIKCEILLLSYNFRLFLRVVLLRVIMKIRSMANGKRDNMVRKSISYYYRYRVQKHYPAIMLMIYIPYSTIFVRVFSSIFFSLLCLRRHRLIWFLILFLCNTGIIYTCTYQWNRYAANPTVISLERDYRSWNGTLPAITICYAIRVDPKKADIYIRKLVHDNINNLCA